MNDYLQHYGVLGMRWGVRKDRRMTERIARAKSSGKTDKAAKLAKKQKEERSISKMAVSDKIFLTRDAVLANQRLIAKGESKAKRLIKLHGVASGINFGTQQATAIAGRSFTNKLLAKQNEGAPLSPGDAAPLIGTVLVSGLIGGAAKKAIYKQMGR